MLKTLCLFGPVFNWHVPSGNPEPDPGGSPCPTSTLPSIPCPTLSLASTSRERRCGSGNRCGHDPKNPNFAPPNPKRPKLINIVIEKIYASYTDLSVLPALNFRIRGFKIRSERREACCKVLAVMMDHTDLATLRVGFPTENGFFNYSQEYLAARMGMGLRRVKRAIRDLKKMGFLIISQTRERLKDGSYRSLAAIKIISARLFDALGIRDWFERERAKARARFRRKEKAHEKASAKRRAKMMNRLTAKVAQMTQIGPARNANEEAQDNWQTSIMDAPISTRSRDPMVQYMDRLNPEAKALISELAVEIKMEHSDWSRNKIYEEAKRCLPSVYRNPKSLPT